MKGDMMDCLISYKNDPNMRQDLKCRAANEIFQILENHHFTHKLEEICSSYMIRFCSLSITKSEQIACLISKVMSNDTKRGQGHTMPKDCLQQVITQFYQQIENLNVDPKLKNACQKEIVKFCLDVQGSVEALECLQSNSVRLGNSCRHSLFSIKKSELHDSSTDYTLVNTCKEMTFRYCKDKETSKLLECLKVYKDEPLFDPRCHLVVVNRMIEQNTEFRFNPSLQNTCGKNINQYCSNIVADAKANEELTGKVINCLKLKFREAKLEHQCEQKMIEILQEQALNFKLNPLLQHFCQHEIVILCKPNGNEIEEHGEVEECLRNAFLQKRIISKECRIEVANLIQESKADIHVDPLLYRSCTADLLKYCFNVKSGDGRQLKCLQTILEDESKVMDEDCRNNLLKRMEMFQNSETILQYPPENITFSQHNIFLVLLVLFVGIVVFLMGMFARPITKRLLRFVSRRVGKKVENSPDQNV